MEVVVERGNVWAAYRRVVENKGAAGVDGLAVPEFKDWLKEHWPTVKAALLAGRYIPQAVRAVGIPKPSGGMRLLGIPTLGSSRHCCKFCNRSLSPDFPSRVTAFALAATPIRR